jgi:hypothetical protein
MISPSRRSAIVAVLVVAVMNMGFPTLAQAGIVDTASLVQSPRDVHLAAIEAQLQRDDVRAELARLGVDESALDLRVASLSDSELAELSKRMQEAPAGGILAVIGVTFVVLLILELVGVIDIFKKVG